MTTTQEKERFFTENHEKFVELVPQLLKKLLDEKARSDQRPTAARQIDSRGKEKPIRVV